MLKKIMVCCCLAVAVSACEQEPHRAGVWMGPTGANVAKMIETEVNFSGGASGRRFETRVVSQRAVVFGELTPQALAASLDSLARDSSVLGLLTRMTDSTTERMTAAFESRGLPYLVATPVAQDYAQEHPHAFMLVPSVEEQSEYLAAQALAEPAPRRVTIMNVREDAADSMAQHIKRALHKKGIETVLVTSFSQSADQLNLLAKTEELIAVKPTLLYWIGRSPSLMVVHPPLRNRFPNVRIISTDLVESFHVYQNPQGIYTGVRFLRYMDPTSKDSSTHAVRERMVMWIGRDELTNESAITFDALHGMVSAIRSGATTRQGLFDYFKKGPTISGISGSVTFGAGQRAVRAMHMAEVKFNGVERLPDPVQVSLQR